MSTGQRRALRTAFNNWLKTLDHNEFAVGVYGCPADVCSACRAHEEHKSPYQMRNTITGTNNRQEGKL